MFKHLHFVIARYNESLDWLPGILDNFSGCKCTVYNKGDDIFGHKSYSIITLKNVGRESETYLNHIIRNYSIIDEEITIFLQGYPFDHCPELLSGIKNALENITYGLFFQNIGFHKIKIENFVPTYHPSIEKELKDTFKELELGDPPKEFYFTAGAMFLVKKKAILNKPKSFYTKAISMVNDEIGPIRGYCFERLWSLIFV